MKAFGFAAALAACLSTASATPTTVSEQLAPRAASSGDMPVITQKGNAFFSGNDRFYIRGVAYQPGGSADVADPLLDTASLTRDIQQFKKLGINTIRVYTIDNSKPHDDAMKMLQAAGIYLALDVNTPTFSLNNADSYNLHLSYNDKYLHNVFSMIDNFKSYNNMLMFFAGNEVINAPNNTQAAPYIKAVVRDMKTYIANRGYRAIPVGYAAADVSQNVDNQLTYMDCGPDPVRVDFFGMNDYSWCDPSSFQQSGWSAKVQRYSDYGSPLFLAEYGCNTNTRTWEEVKTLYSTQMSPVYSGGIAYEYSLETNGYGLVDMSGGSLEPNADFKRLADQLSSTTDPAGLAGARTGAPASKCPAYSQDWNVRNLTLPAPPTGIKKYYSNGAGLGPGLTKDDSSQWGGSSRASSSYSNSWIQMDGAEPTGVASQSSSNGGSSSSSSGSSSDGSNAASGLQLGATTLLLTVGAILGALLL